MASQKQLDAKFKQAQVTADDWLRRAELAVSKGEDDLAREALKRRKTYQDQADSFKGQMGAQATAVDNLIANTRVLGARAPRCPAHRQPHPPPARPPHARAAPLLHLLCCFPCLRTTQPHPTPSKPLKTLS